MAILAPSVLAADFARLGEEITDAEQNGADYFHLDIMDGHFVPNISFGPSIVKTINKLTDGFLDVHLMLSEPEKYFEDFAGAGADNITFHISVHPDPVVHAEAIHKLGIKAGISANPDVLVDRVKPYLEHFDTLLLMSVFPGFGGQKFIESVLPKIAEAREFIDKHGLSTKISVDGGVDAENAKLVVDAGADILVMGTAFFHSDDRAAMIRLVNQL